VIDDQGTSRWTPFHEAQWDMSIVDLDIDHFAGF
jgi:hypothetical protein